MFGAMMCCAVPCWVMPLCLHSSLRSILQRLSQNGLLARFVIDEVMEVLKGLICSRVKE